MIVQSKGNAVLAFPDYSNKHLQNSGRRGEVLCGHRTPRRHARVAECVEDLVILHVHTQNNTKAMQGPHQFIGP